MLLTLGIIVYQDIKDRLVWWFLFPVFAFIGAYLYFQNTYSAVFLYSVGMNLLLVFAIVTMVWLYNKLFLKRDFLTEAFGLADILFLVGFALAFPTLSFIVLLVFSLFFALATQLVLKSFRKDKSVPLAGHMSIFLIGVYIASWSGLYTSLYLI